MDAYVSDVAEQQQRRQPPRPELLPSTRTAPRHAGFRLRISRCGEARTHPTSHIRQRSLHKWWQVPTPTTLAAAKRWRLKLQAAPVPPPRCSNRDMVVEFCGLARLPALPVPTSTFPTSIWKRLEVWRVKGCWARIRFWSSWRGLRGRGGTPKSVPDVARWI